MVYEVVTHIKGRRSSRNIFCGRQLCGGRAHLCLSRVQPLPPILPYRSYSSSRQQVLTPKVSAKSSPWLRYFPFENFVTSISICMSPELYSPFRATGGGAQDGKCRHVFYKEMRKSTGQRKIIVYKAHKMPYRASKSLVRKNFLTRLKSFMGALRKNFAAIDRHPP